MKVLVGAIENDLALTRVIAELLMIRVNQPVVISPAEPLPKFTCCITSAVPEGEKLARKSEERRRKIQAQSSIRRQSMSVQR